MSFLIAVHHAVPPGIVTNHDLTKFMDTSDEWIKTRSGIKERRWVRDGNREGRGISNQQLAFEAASKALREAEISPQEIDLICYATISADNEMPGSGVLLQQMLAPEKAIPIFEIRNQCSGFIYALQVARGYIEAGAARNALVIGAEIQSTGLDLSDRGRNTAVLFADGAGAAVISSEPPSAQGQSAEGHKLLSVSLASDGTHADKLGVALPGFAGACPIREEDFDGAAVYPSMDGKFVFKMASLCMPRMVREVVINAGYSMSDLRCVIPHQANQRIIEMLAKDLGREVNVFSNIALYGNTTAASIPLALSEASRQGIMSAGDLVCLVSFGAGFSWGAALIRW